MVAIRTGGALHSRAGANLPRSKNSPRLETHLGGGIFGKRWRSPPRLTQGCALSQ